MSQKQKQKKQRLTAAQIQLKFQQADLNGDGSLSASQISTLIQNLGYNDTYKGTIKKICRKLQQVKLNKPRILVSTQQEGQEQQKQAEINFEQFKSYFDILDDPISIQIFNMTLDRQTFIIETSQKLKLKQVFQKQKGQRLNVSLLVGQKQQKYNSNMFIKIKKKPNIQQKPKKYYFSLSISSSSSQNAIYIKQKFQGLYDFLVQMGQAEGQHATKFLQRFTIEIIAIGREVKVNVIIEDSYLQQFLAANVQVFDELFQTEVSFLIIFFLKFNFNIIDLKDKPNSNIEDIFLKNCHIRFNYKGSQFMNSIKELAIIHEVWQIIKNNGFYADHQLTMLYGLLMLEQADIQLNFKNISATQNQRENTNALISMFAIINQIPPELFDYRSFAQKIDGPIILKAEIKNFTIDMEVNIKDLFKLPIIFQDGQTQGGFDSD